MRKTPATVQQQLHLVTAEEAAAGSQQQDALLASGIRHYEKLQQAADRELFGRQDPERLIVLYRELQTLRERLARYGVHVRS